MKARIGLRTAMAIVVVAVAGFAAVQSFSHIYWFGQHGGQNRIDSILLPLSVDGLILAMTLTLLHEARAGRRAYWLTYVMLWAGIGATVSANVVYGLPFGPIGIAASAWPACAFIGAVHVMARVVRTWHEQATVKQKAPRSAAVPGSAEQAARLALEASVAATNPLSERALVSRFGITRTAAKKMRAELNGHADVSA